MNISSIYYMLYTASYGASRNQNIILGYTNVASHVVCFNMTSDDHREFTWFIVRDKKIIHFRRTKLEIKNYVFALLSKKIQCLSVRSKGLVTGNIYS